MLLSDQKVVLMRLLRADEIVLSLGNEVSQWQEEVPIGPGGPARRNRIFGSGKIRDPENNVVFLDDMQPGGFFLMLKKKLSNAWDCGSRCERVAPRDYGVDTQAGCRCGGTDSAQLPRGSRQGTLWPEEQLLGLPLTQQQQRMGAV